MQLLRAICCMLHGDGSVALKHVQGAKPYREVCSSSTSQLLPCSRAHQQVHPQEDGVGKVGRVDVVYGVLGGALPDAAGDERPRQDKDQRVGYELQLLPAAASSVKKSS